MQEVEGAKYKIENKEEDIYDLQLSDDEDDDSVINAIHTEEVHQNKADEVNNPKRKKLVGPFDISFKCEWKNCEYETQEESVFHVHVSYHIPDVEVKTLGNGEEVYVCLWTQCSYMTGGVKEIQRHVTFHSYHTKLKNIGAKIIEEWKLPKCTYGGESRNMLPEKMGQMVCEWDGCNKEFNNVQVFLHHIHTHVQGEDCQGSARVLRCKWLDCTLHSGMRSKTRLMDHMRTHTKEKVVACPTCGNLFATNTKLNDHCKRQIPDELSDFQCSHCYKHFPCLRLLKDHMRGHVNFYKCCYCDMTCTSRQTFSAHIRYKHLDSKPFKCSYCEYTCKTQFDLKAHLNSHNPEDQFECGEEGCDFTCRTKQTLKNHFIDEHRVSVPLYCCHLPDCQARYKRGCYLTKHLMTKHCLRWPSGHSKFMYSRQEDGTFRLQTVRYESVKLYGENTNSSRISPSKANYKCSPNPGDGSRSFRVSAIEPDSEKALSQVIISIEDEKGNTINCCTAPESVGNKIPKNATVIAKAEDVHVQVED